MMKKRTVVGATISAVALAVSGCSGAGSSAGSSDDGTYDVFLSAGISAQGVLAANAQTSILAAKAGAKVQNDQGGINGEPVNLTIIDDGGDPTKAVTNLRKAINENKPDLYLNSGPSSVASAVLPVLKSGNILSFNIAPTEDSGDPDEYPLNFDLSPSAEFQAHAIVKHAKSQGYSRIGVLHGNTAFGEQFGDGASKWLSNTGLEEVGNQEYDVDSLDMTAQLQALKNSGAEFVILDAYGASLGHVLDGVERLGWDIPMVGDTSVSATDLVSNDPPNGVLGTNKAESLKTEVYASTVHTPDDDRVNKMVDTMASLGEIPTTLIMAWNYDPFPLVASAARTTGGTEPKQIAAALEDKDVQKDAETATLSEHNFSSDSHSPTPDLSEVVITTPTRLINGQFGNPEA